MEQRFVGSNPTTPSIVIGSKLTIGWSRQTVNLKLSAVRGSIPFASTIFWRIGRVVECNVLENRKDVKILHGFESRILLHLRCALEALINIINIWKVGRAWFNAPDLKSGDGRNPVRGFESHTFLHFTMGV